MVEKENPPSVPAPPSQPDEADDTQPQYVSLYQTLVRLFVRHKNIGNLLMICMIVFGFFGGSKLDTQFLPNVEFEIISVSIVWPGASAEDVDLNIIEPLQSVLRYIDGVDDLNSTAREGVASFNIEFRRGWDVAKAKSDVEGAIDQVTTLPVDIERPIVKHYVDYFPVGSVLIYGPFPESVLKNEAQKIRDGLLATGIDKVTFSGLREEEIWVETHPDQIRRYDLTPGDIAKAIRASSIDTPGGTLYADVERQIRSKGLAKTSEAIADIVVRTRNNGERVLVSDVATVSERFDETQATGWVDNMRAIQLDVQRSEHTDSLLSLERLRTYIGSIQPSLPQGLTVKIYITWADKIAQRINVLVRNGIGGMFLVLITLFLFLNFRVAFWVALGIPISILMTLGLMWPMNQSINMVSMFAFIMTMGIIVDDAIVVGEHSSTVFARGNVSAAYAAERGALRMTRPIFAAALTTMAAFLPMLLIDSVFGDFMRPIPIVVSAVLIASLLECFFILPAHMKHALSKPEKPVTGFRKKFHDGFENFRQGRFRKFIAMTYDNRYVTLSTAIACLIIAIGLFAGGRLQFSFFPSPEPEAISARIAYHPGTPRHVTKQGMQIVQSALHETDKALREGDKSLIKGTFSLLGTNGINSGNQYATVLVELSPSEDRDVRTFDFVEHWKKQIPEIAGVRNIIVGDADEGPGGAPIEVRLYGDSPIALKIAAEELKETLALYDGVQSPRDNLSYGKQEFLMSVNPRGAALGFTNQNVGEQVRNAFEGVIAQRFARGDSEVTVRVLLSRQQGITQRLDTLYLVVPNSNPPRYLPLPEVVDVVEQSGFAMIRRSGNAREVSVTANFSAEAGNPSNVVNDVVETKLPALEAKYNVSRGVGNREIDIQKVIVGLFTGMIMALGVIYVILAIVFASYSRPIVIMSIIPFGLVGAFLGHLVQNFDLTYFSIIALLGLSGILVNNSIILISRIDERVAMGESTRDALMNGVGDRLRPVVLTSTTTVLGLAPMLFETSAQSQFLLPMVITIAWGLATSSLLVLVLVPAILGIQEDCKAYFARARAPKTDYMVSE